MNTDITPRIRVNLTAECSPAAAEIVADSLHESYPGHEIIIDRIGLHRKIEAEDILGVEQVVNDILLD